MTNASVTSSSHRPRILPEQSSQSGPRPTLTLLRNPVALGAAERMAPQEARQQPPLTGLPSIDDPSDAAIEREAGIIARNISQAAVEVLAGVRPARQLSRWLSPRCYSALLHRTALTQAHGANHSGQHLHRNPQVRAVRACAISQEVCEVSIVVTEEFRSRAIAMRLELTDDAWHITELEIG